jgi:hypothetical protein
MDDRILITGDFLRPAIGRWEPSQHFNIRWLQQLLGVQIRLATGAAPDILAWNGASVEGGLASKDISAFYKAVGVPQTIDGWAKISTMSDAPDALEAQLLDKISSTLLIGFETPPHNRTPRPEA